MEDPKVTPPPSTADRWLTPGPHAAAGPSAVALTLPRQLVAENAVGPSSARPPLPVSYRRVSTATTVLLVVRAVVAALTIPSTLIVGAMVQARLSASRGLPARDGWEETLTRHATVLVWFGWAALVLTLTVAALFLVWTGLLHGSDRVDRRELRRSTGWAVGSWFVPIISLWWPMQSVGDLWWAATPAQDRPGMPRYRGTPAVVRWWWATLLLALFSNNVATRMIGRGDAIDDYRLGIWMTVASSCLVVVCSSLAAVIVRRITQRLT